MRTLSLKIIVGRLYIAVKLRKNPPFPPLPKGAEAIYPDLFLCGMITAEEVMGPGGDLVQSPVSKRRNTIVVHLAPGLSIWRSLT